jgi:hypothetical protein
LAYDVVVLNPVCFAPGAYDIGVIVGYNTDNIDTFCADLWKRFNALGNVASGADWCEGTGESKEDDFLTGPLSGGVVVDRDPTSRDAGSLRGVRDIPA